MSDTDLINVRARTKIRSVEPEDYAAVKTIYEQPAAFAGTLQMPYPSKEIWKARLEKPPPGMKSLLAIVDGVAVGHIGLIPVGNPRRQHTASVGMAVHDDYAGRGIGDLLMTEVLTIADDWMNVLRVELTVYSDNERAIRLYQRHGFEREGTLISYAFRDGQYVDAYAMARIRAR